MNTHLTFFMIHARKEEKLNDLPIFTGKTPEWDRVHTL